MDVSSTQRLRHFVLAVKELWGTAACCPQVLLQKGSHHKVRDATEMKAQRV